MKFLNRAACAGALFLALLGRASLPARADTNAFAWPAITAQTRPWTWWWWHGSAVDKTNITHELQRFHDAGLGGVQITAIFGARGAEARDIPYLSPRWLAMMSYTVDEARRLGMSVTMTLGTGWCFGGPTVSDQDANASVVVKTFDVAVGERLTEKFDRKTTQALVAFGPDGKPVDLTGSIATNGEVIFSPPGNWTGTNAAPPRTWTVYAISQKPSGQKVKRPAPGGEGWMLNPAYPQAVTNWLKWFDIAFANYTGSKPEAVFQDSYEYRTDWALDFFAQFEKLRGYKLQTELPALFADESRSADHASRFTDPDHIARVKYDYRRTLSDIMAGESEPAWINWAHRNGFSTIYQAHGTPGNWLDLYADADIPETEMFRNDRSVLISKFASSAAHTQGRALTGAETGTWVKEHFTETLADLKYLADDIFLAGVNRIFYHGACYSPDDAPWPGWLFYASTEMNPRNPIWHDVPALNDYIARCQSILQSGQPDNDVLLYWPVADFWSNPSGRVQPMTVSQTAWFEDQPIGKTAHELWNKGYSFDYVSDAQLKTAKVVDGTIQMPGGKYQVIVVPECKYMPVETFKQLFALAADGATIIFLKQLPEDASGFKDLEKQRNEYKQLVSKLSFNANPDFGGTIRGNPIGSQEEAKFGKGVIVRRELIGLFPLKNVEPEGMALDGLSFVRRSFDGGWNYFIVNSTDKEFNGTICPQHTGFPIILDPMTGKSGLAYAHFGGPDGGIGMSLNLQLAPRESVILRVLNFDGKEIAANLKVWHYNTTSGAPTEITGQWKVKFILGGPTLPADFQTAKLASWTTFPDTNTQSFAGTAKYEITFDAPSERGLSQAAARPTASDPLRVETARAPYFLDLGDVRQSARAKLNGKDYGTLITPPFRVVVDNLKPTGNLLEVEVTSVAANRIRDLDRRGVPWKIFKDINVVNENYRPFDASNWPLTDCGLLGPVTLTPVTAK